MVSVVRVLLAGLAVLVLAACGSAGEIAGEMTEEVSVMSGSQREALESAGFESVVVITNTTAKEVLSAILVTEDDEDLAVTLVYWTRPPTGRRAGWHHKGIYLGASTPTPDQVLEVIEAGGPTGSPAP